MSDFEIHGHLLDRSPDLHESIFSSFYCQARQRVQAIRALDCLQIQTRWYSDQRLN